MSGIEANGEDRYPDWYEDPHDPDSLVVEFVTSETKNVEMLRAHGEENQNRYWLIPPKEIGGISPGDVDNLSAEDVQEALALPEPPKYLSKVIVPAKTAMRISSINENFGKEGTWPQAELEERLDDDAYEIVRTFEQSDTMDEGDLK